ncbi:MAG: archaellin/type IV pilin N-terminal domain-containing protein [Candidatus Thorarchaeota archaeon]
MADNVIMINKAILRLKRGKRAVSPIVAAILLIGLTVAAGAIVFFIVLPLFEGEAQLDLVEDSTFVRYFEGNGTHGWGEAGIMVVNSGNADAKIDSEPKVYYEQADSGSGFPFQIDASNVTTEDSISATNALEIGSASEYLITIYFVLPVLNENNSVDYKFEIKYLEGTVKAQKGVDGDLTLLKDRPTIILDVDNYVRRTYDIAPTISENDEVKNVTYHVYDNATGEQIDTYDTDSSPYAWSWNTKANTTSNPGIDIRVEVWDYANLNDFVWVNDVQLDNDYIAPEILAWNTSAPFNNNTVELGEFASVRANVTDSGSLDSRVGYVYLHYKVSTIDDNVYLNASTTMSQIGATDTYQANIPSSAINLAAFSKNMTYWIEAIDIDGNSNSSADKPGPQHVAVVDTEAPNIDHTPTTTAYYRDAVEISATISDPGEAQAILYYRTNPAASFVPYQMTNDSATSFSYTIPTTRTGEEALLNNIQYYIEAYDLTVGNLAQEGTSTDYYNITVVDDWDPYTYQSANSTSAVNGADLEIATLAYDNDPSFAESSSPGENTGQVYLYYRQGLTGAWTEEPMTTNYDAIGYTANGFKITRWTATIPGTSLTTGQTTYYYLEARDQALNSGLPGYNNTFFWGTEGSPIAITVGAISEPTLLKSQAATISADGLTVTYYMIVTGSTAKAVTVNVTWDTVSAVNLVGIYIGGGSVWTGTASNVSAWTTALDITDTSLSIAEYEVRLVFDAEVFDTDIVNRFNTTYNSDTSFKVQDNITLSIPAAPTYNVAYVAGTANARRTGGFFNRRYWLDFNVENLASAVTITGIRLVYTGGDSIEQVQWFAGTTQWTGSAGTGTLLTFSNPPIFLATSIQTFTLETSGDVTGETFTVTLYYAGGSSQTLTSFQPT